MVRLSKKLNYCEQVDAIHYIVFSDRGLTIRLIAKSRGINFILVHIVLT